MEQQTSSGVVGYAEIAHPDKASRWSAPWVPASESEKPRLAGLFCEAPSRFELLYEALQASA